MWYRSNHRGGAVHQGRHDVPPKRAVRRLRRSLVLLSVIAIVSVGAIATGPDSNAQATGTVSGTVMLEGSPFANVEVFLWVGFPRHTCTDASGAFEFADVPLDTDLFSAAGFGTPGRCANFAFLAPNGDQVLNQFYNGYDGVQILDTFMVTAANPTVTSDYTPRRVAATEDHCSDLLATIVGTGIGPLNGTPDADVILGTPGDDVINGFGGADVICAEAGRDFVYGGDGADRIFGGSEIDRIWGQGDDDVIFGDGGSDRIRAGSGNDTVLAGSGADRVWGGSGDDILNGMGGQDSMWGEVGNDTMQGNWQSDSLYGGPGNDKIYAAGGKDKLFGEGGNDEMFGGANTDYLDGGPGVDVANGGKGKDNPLVTNVSGCVAETKISC